MNHSDRDKPSLFERIFAGVFSAIAAGVTYAVWLFFNTGKWEADQIQALQDMGKWITLAGGALGFAGGISLAAQIWGHIWDTTHQPLLSLRTFFTVLVLVSIAYGVYKYVPF